MTKSGIYGPNTVGLGAGPKEVEKSHTGPRPKLKLAVRWSLDKVTRVQFPENNGNRPGTNPEHRKWNDVRFFPRGMEFEQDF